MTMMNRLLLVIIVLFYCTCGGGEFIYFQITGTPSTARSIGIYMHLNGVPANEEILLDIPPGNEILTAGLRISVPREGELIADVGVFDAEGCLLAVGSGSLMLTLADEYRELRIAVERRPGLAPPCSPRQPLLFSVTPSSLRTSGRDETHQPVPVRLRGWGFVPSMQVTIGARLQKAPRFVSSQEVVIEEPQVARELGPVSIRIERPDHSFAVLENALTVKMTAVVTQLATPPIGGALAPIVDLAAFDLEGDGKLDIAVVDNQAKLLLYGYQAGTGLVAKGTMLLAAIGIVPGPNITLLGGDLDGDAKDELVVVTGGRICVLRYQPGGPLTVTQSTDAIDGRDAALADMDGDGKLDLVRVSTNVSVFRSVSGGTFLTVPSMQYPLTADAVRTADMNRDGRPDVLTLTASGELSVLLNNGGGLSLHFQYPLRGACSGSPPVLAVQDLDGDGSPDVVINGITALTLNPGEELSLKYINRIAVCYGGVSVASADLNSDGEPDLAWLQSQSVYLIPQAGFARFDGQFGQLVNTPSLGNLPLFGPRRMPAADINGDGTPDLVIGYGALLTVPQ